MKMTSGAWKAGLAAVSILAVAWGGEAQGASAYNVGGAGKFTVKEKESPAALATSGRFNPRAERGDVISPIGLGILPPMQWPSETGDVILARVALFWAENHNVSFFDVGGFATLTGGDFTGFQLGGIWNHVGGNAGGVQVGGIGNSIGGDFTGIQVASVVNYMDGGGVLSGLQLAVVANMAGDGAGLQIGLYNGAGDFQGLQIGLVNSAKHLQGLQIGLLNFIEDSTLPFCPILGVGF